MTDMTRVLSTAGEVVATYGCEWNEAHVVDLSSHCPTAGDSSPPCWPARQQGDLHGKHTCILHADRIEFFLRSRGRPGETGGER